MSNIYVGMDVHQRSITLAVLPAGRPHPPPLNKSRTSPARSEASAAGFVLHRALTAWGHACTVIAPPAVQRLQ